MKTPRPTPETDKFFATFADGEAAPSHAEYYARLQDLERERDRLAEALQKVLKSWDDETWLDENEFESFREALKSLTPNSHENTTTTNP